MNTKCLKRGFTLIELLVVVLIIGILAAVALPQYQKAVDKSRVSQGVQLISSLQKATEVWILEHPGENAYDFFQEDATHFLDIDLPCWYQDSDRCRVGKNIGETTIEISTTGSAIVFLRVYWDSSWDEYLPIGALRDANGQWSYKCGYYNDRGKAICDGLQGYTSIQNWEY